MRINLSKTFLYSFTLTLGICTGFVAVAWTGPSGTAPNNNVSAPINTSSTAQSKVGGLVLNTGGAANGLITYGNVGIGTANPGASLQVVNAAGTLLKLSYDSSGTADYSISRNPSTGSLSIQGSQTGYNNILLAPTSGSVGIGTASPYNSGNTPLSVDNHSAASWTAIINYNNGSPVSVYGLYSAGSTYAIYGQGPVYTNSSFNGPAFYYTSDVRLKKNIQSIASSTALTKILALNPVTFNWIDPKAASSTQVGFIAQEVEEVVPELVTVNASGMKEVDYARFTPLLVGAVQAQQAEIEAQDAKINAQQAEIDQLKAEVELLKAQR